MKSIELTAYAVREYDVKYTIVLDETDPILVKYLTENDLTLDDLLEGGNGSLWDTIMSTPETDIQIQEDFGMSEERFVDFDSFITENPLQSSESVVG